MNGKSMSNYLDRELTRLAFNSKVLQESTQKDVPLLERIQYCAIYTNNIDEIFMTRVPQFEDRAILCDCNSISDAANIEKNIEQYYNIVKSQYIQRDKSYNKINTELLTAGVMFLKWNQLEKTEKKQISNFYKRVIRPELQVAIIAESSQLKKLKSGQTYLMLRLKKRKDKSLCGNRIIHAVIPIPSLDGKCWHNIILDNQGKIKSIRYMPIEHILMRFAEDLFHKYTVKSKLLFKITRRANNRFDEDNSEISAIYQENPKRIQKLLDERSKMTPIKLEYLYSNSRDDTKEAELLQKLLSLDKRQIYAINSPLSYDYLDDLKQVVKKLKPTLLYSPIPPIESRFSQSIFARIEKNDLLMNYPYHSISTYLDFLRAAAYDPDVTSIKITLYRLSHYSEIVSLLKCAAEHGKEVTAAIELKARFDEADNIHWAEVLEEAGCKVVYGFEELKIHAKLTLVTLNKQNSTRQYAHIATGNYNEKTAKQYTDVGILTADSEICSDIDMLFCTLENGELTSNYKRLLVSPTCLKSRIISEIDAEKMAAKSGDVGYICMKMNGLTDSDIIEALYKASNAGVKIDLIVRGVCCLRPGIRGVSENIRVISIVGRYLEHSRIYIFGNNPQVRRTYIGSADMMTRNTERRVEVLTPILDTEIAQKLYQLTRIQLSDNIKAWDMLPDGSYKKREPQTEVRDSQIDIYNLYK